MHDSLSPFSTVLHQLLKKTDSKGKGKGGFLAATFDKQETEGNESTESFYRYLEKYKAKHDTIGKLYCFSIFIIHIYK
jgi:hypothetical protein